MTSKTDQRIRGTAQPQPPPCYWCCGDEASLCLHSREKCSKCAAAPAVEDFQGSREIAYECYAAQKAVEDAPREVCPTCGGNANDEAHRLIAGEEATPRTPLRDLAALSEKATPGEWRKSSLAHLYLIAGDEPTPICSMGEYKEDSTVDGEFENWQANSAFIIACVDYVRAALRAATPQPRGLLDHDDESLLASATDLLNTWAREMSVEQARTPDDIRGVIDRLWSELSTRLFRPTQGED
jgi:hypothetical protein